MEVSAGAVAVDDVPELELELELELLGVYSGGHESPGWSMKDDDMASSRCVTRDTEAFGLITPTMPYPMHELIWVQ